MDDASEVKARLRAQIAAIEGGVAGGAASSNCDGTPDDGLIAAAPEPTVEEEAERAFRKIERLACMREQASVALRRRLVREGFPEEAVEQALKRALVCGLVDDRRYADVLVRSRLSQGRGRRGIAAELADLGIEPDEVEAFAMDDGDDASEVERALALLERKPPRAKNARDAAYRRLAQKGYSASAASTAARLWCEAHREEGRLT